MIVPLSEAVANKVPSPFSVMHERGDRWASITLMASSLTVSNINTSPVVGDMWVVLLGGACAGGAKDEGGAFCGNGYAR
jgi:hypothetical protein